VKAPTGLEVETRVAIDANFRRIEFNEAILIESLEIRRTYLLKLPDALIWACARVIGWNLVTRNTKDFLPTWAGIRVPYRLEP
jgi:predicted nucleic acid-binding protein